MSMSNNTQLTPAEGYKPRERMIFSEPISGTVPDSKPKIEFKRINITTRNEDGTIGELIIPTPDRVFSFGVGTNDGGENPKNPGEEKKINGYTFPLCLWNRENPTQEEKNWTDTFESIVDTCIDYLLDHKEEIDQLELTRADLTKAKGGINPLYWKREKVTDNNGKTVLRKVPNQGPTLYAKLIYSKKNDKFLTQFFDLNDEPINARDLIGKYCHASAAIKVESIFISGTSKISLQVKLYEAVVEVSNMGMKRLLDRPKSSSRVLSVTTGKTAGDVMGNNHDDPDVSSLAGSDNEEKQEKPERQVKPAATPVAAPVKRVVRRVAK